MSLNKPAALLAALVLLVSVVAVPGIAAAEEHLEVTVEQQPDTGDALVTVTDGDTPVENATVAVDAADDYDGTGTYTTDANGTVTLPSPDETVTVTLTVNHSGTTQTTEAELVPRADSLDIAVEGGVEENATVTVTQYDVAVENASLSVSGDDYDGNGTYTTDANGTVELPAPDSPTDVTLNASADDLSTERTVTLGEHELELDVDDGDDGVTVEVTRNDTGVEGANVTVEAADGESYAGDGDYVTDENGTVDLPAPEGTVNVTVTATDGDDTVSENVTLDNETATEYRTFGGMLSAYVHQLLSGAAGGIGDDVSEFARENNPGNADHDENGNATADDKPGKGDEMRPDDRGERDEENTTDTTETSDEDVEDEDDEDEDDERRGPPSQANN